MYRLQRSDRAFYFPKTKALLSHRRAFFKDFSVEGPTTKRDFSEKRKSGEVFPFGGSGGPLPENFFVFLSSLDLICAISA